METGCLDAAVGAEYGKTARPKRGKGWDGIIEKEQQRGVGFVLVFEGKKRGGYTAKNRNRRFILTSGQLEQPLAEKQRKKSVGDGHPVHWEEISGTRKNCVGELRCSG